MITHTPIAPSPWGRRLTRRRAVAALGATAAAIPMLSACSGSNGEAGEVVVYTPNEQNMLDAIIPAFEEETGIKVELVTAGSGELVQRIASEASSPQGDLMFGGSTTAVDERPELWAPYQPTGSDELIEIAQNTSDIVNPFQVYPGVLLVNEEQAAAAGVSITSYADLLDPALQGNIAMGDPTQSSSAFDQLTNILVAMGGYESDEAWAFVEDFVAHLDGSVIGSSTQVFQDVANGEFVMGLNNEPLAMNFKLSGAPVEVVYPEEGSALVSVGVYIVADGPNPENAEAFVDFMTSETGQQALAEETNGRPVLEGVENPELPSLSEFTTIDPELDYATEHRDEILARWQEILQDAS